MGSEECGEPMQMDDARNRVGRELGTGSYSLIPCGHLAILSPLRSDDAGDWCGREATAAMTIGDGCARQRGTEYGSLAWDYPVACSEQSRHPRASSCVTILSTPVILLIGDRVQDNLAWDGSDS